MPKYFLTRINNSFTMLDEASFPAVNWHNTENSVAT